MSTAGTLFVPGIVAMLATVLAVPVVIWGARRNGVVSRPRADRWSQRTVALLGGIGMGVGVVAGFLAFEALFKVSVPTWVVVGSALMFATGLVDDLYDIPPVAKLLAQIVAAAIPIAVGVRFGDSLPQPISIPITLLWIIGITNALNLIDGMDGLASGIAAIAAFMMGLLAYAFGANDLAAWLFVVMGAALGFLAYNHRPAAIFMGDCGSLLLGYLLAAGALIVQPLSEARFDRIFILLVPAAILAVPILDTTFVAVARLIHGRKVSVGGNDHLMHRLVHLGLSEGWTVMTLWGVSAAVGGLALLPLFTSTGVAYVLAGGYFVALSVLAVYVGQADVYGHREDHVDPEHRLSVNVFASALQRRLGHNWKAIVGMGGDVVIVVTAFFGAYLLQERIDLWHTIDRAALLVPGVLLLKLGVFYALHLYRGIWRYAGTPEILRVGIATAISAVLLWTFAWFYVGVGLVTLEVVIIDAMLTFFGLMSVRVGLRAIRQAMQVQHRLHSRRVIVYGAGDSGLLLVRELRQNDLHGLTPVAFLDDDPLKHGMSVQGVRVVGGVGALEGACRDKDADLVVLSNMRMTEARRRAVEQACSDAGVECQSFSLSINPVDITAAPSSGDGAGDIRAPELAPGV